MLLASSSATCWATLPTAVVANDAATSGATAVAGCAINHRQGVIVSGHEVDGVGHPVEGEESRKVADIELRPGLITTAEMTLVAY